MQVFEWRIWRTWSNACTVKVLPFINHKIVCEKWKKQKGPVTKLSLQNTNTRNISWKAKFGYEISNIYNLNHQHNYRILWMSVKHR